MRFADLVEASRAISATRARSTKIALLAECLRRMEPDEIPIGVGLLSGSPRQGRIGIGPAALRRAAGEPAAPQPRLTLADVDRGFSTVAEAVGAGSDGRRLEALRELFR